MELKRVLAVILCALMAVATLSASAAGVQLAEVSAIGEPDVSFAMEVTQTIADMGDNPDVGNRSSGSAAERQAAEYIQSVMAEIGLSNVTMDTFTADNWSFNRGRVYYTDVHGELQYLPLGGFATNLTCELQEAELVYAGRGTAADYEGLDVEGKVVLIDIDQSEDWWIEIPTYEAHLRGALCVLACNVSGYAYYDGDTIGSQDICGPADAPAFSVSQNGAAALRAAIEAGGGVAQIVLDVDSVVTMDGASQNVWGEIPGSTDEVIYFFAHYDGYYHSYFDDASGVGSMLAIAKAMIDAGYEPDKTIRFVAHGAEEWGDSDTEYDWGIGAFKQITEVHPEWAEDAFAILNIDGMYPVEGHTAFAVAATYELGEFARENGEPLYQDGAYGFEVTMPTGCSTEDFSYVMAGVPSIVASYAEPHDLYHGAAYHSSMDNVILGVDEDAWQLMLNLFAGYARALDALACRPMDFTARIEALEAACDGKLEIDLSELYAAAEALDGEVESINAGYAEALASGDAETAAALRESGLALDEAMFEIFREVAAATVAFDWEDNVVFPFEVTWANIEALESAIASLEAGDAATALDEYLYCVDYNWYAYEFSQETYDYMLDKMYVKAEGTWGEGMIRFPGENLWTVIHSLMDKAEQEGPDYSDEIAALQESLERQYGYAEEAEAQLTEDAAHIAEMMALALQAE